MIVAFSGFLIGILVYLGMALFLGMRRSAALPGGAIVAGIVLGPWYVSIPAALVGHFLAAWVCTRMNLDHSCEENVCAEELEQLFKSDASDDDCFVALLTFMGKHQDNQENWGKALELANCHRKEAFERKWTQHFLRGTREVMPELYERLVRPNERPDCQ